MQSIPDGKYKIFSMNNNFIVGRKPSDDKPLRPDPVGIYTIDPEAGIDGGRSWTVENVGGGRCKLRAGDAPVGDLDGLLWALFTEEEQDNAGEWLIQSVPQMGKDRYIITRPDMMTGWAATTDQDADEKQIAVRPLIAQPSFPPRYPAFEVFVIKPAN